MSDTRFISQTLSSPQLKEIDAALQAFKKFDLEFLSDLKKEMISIQSDKSLPVSEKRNACSVISDLCTISEDLSKSGSLDELEKFSVHSLICQKENAQFFYIDSLMRALHKQNNLDTSSDAALIPFCSNSKSIKDYVMLGARYKASINTAITFKNSNKQLVENAKSNLSKLAEIRAQLNKLHLKISSFEKSDRTLKIQAAYLLVDVSISMIIKRIDSWINIDNTPSESFNRASNDSIASILKFSNAWDATCILMKRYDHIVALRSKLVEIALHKQEAQKQKGVEGSISSSLLTSASQHTSSTQKSFISSMHSPNHPTNAKNLSVTATTSCMTPQKSN